VDKKSAQLGLGGNREQLVPMDADHNGICKFASEDSVYEQVEGNIRDLIDGAVEIATYRSALAQDQARKTPTISPLLSFTRQFSSPLLGGGQPERICE